MATKKISGFSLKALTILKTVSFLFVFILLIVSLSTLHREEFFPIKKVKIFGVQHVDHQEVQSLIAPLVNQGFFAVDVDRIKELILQLPWVSEVMVRRIWPDQVVITINERNPIALWNDMGLLSSAGDVFSPPTETYPAGLPTFLGPTGQQMLMAEYYDKLNSILLSLHFKIARLELTPALAWNITLNNGIKLNVGHKDILTRIDHFVKVYPKIVGDRVNDVEYIDLRYPNGMAVRWKSVT